MPNLRYVIIGKRWFNRRTGNTYHSVSVYDAETGKTHDTGTVYGYDDQWIETASDLLETGYDGLRDMVGSGQAYWQIVDVRRKADL